MSTFFAKITAFFMAILAFFGLIKPVDTSKIDLKDGYQVTVEKKDINVFLESNPSTGYAWSYTKEGQNISYVSQQYVQKSNGLLGAGGVDCFRFKARTPGTAQLNFVYKKTGTPGYAKKLTVDITVDGKMNVTVKAEMFEPSLLDLSGYGKEALIRYCVDAYNQIGQKAKKVTLVSEKTENYKNIMSFGGSTTVETTLKSVIKNLLEGTGEPEDRAVAELPPLGGKNLSIAPESIAAVSLTDKGDVYEITLTSTGTEENPEVDVLPGEGSVGCIGVVTDPQDIVHNGGNSFEIEGVHIYYTTATLKVTIDKASGVIEALHFDTPSVINIDRVKIRTLTEALNCKMGLRVIQDWTVTY